MVLNMGEMTSEENIRCDKCGSENPCDNVFCGICGSRLGPHPGESITLEDLTEEKLLKRALEGRFRIIDELGRGGFGVVFRAEDLQLGRHVAIKVLHLTKSGDKGLVHRFVKEARLSAKLEHPNIARIYTIDFAGFIHYFIMEYITGPTIKDVLMEHSVFSSFYTVKFGRDIARALAFAHTQQIIHRDIKPANVILKNKETAVVTDFGIAKALWSDATGLTTGAIGTPVYMSPEQFRGEELDGRADQYAMGILFYEMLVGDVPFIGSGAQLIQKHLSMDPPPLRQRNPSIPVELENIVLTMLAKKRTNRFPDCQAVLDALSALDPEDLPRDSVVTSDKTTWEGPTINQLIDDGRKALEQNDYPRAYDLLYAAGQMDPHNSDVEEMLNRVLINKGKAQEFEQFVKNGISRFHDARYTEAIKSWENALEIYPANTELPKLIERARKKQHSTKRGEDLKIEGIRAVEQHRYDTAIQRFKAAGELLNSSENIDELIKDAENRRLRADDAEEMLIQADKLRGENQFDEAIDLYEKILKIDPHRRTAQKGLRDVIKARDEGSDAESVEGKRKSSRRYWFFGVILAVCIIGGGFIVWIVTDVHTGKSGFSAFSVFRQRTPTPIPTVTPVAPTPSPSVLPTVTPTPQPTKRPTQVPRKPTRTPAPTETWTPRPLTPQQKVMKAQRWVSDKHFRKALMLLNDVLREDPANEGAKRLRFEVQDVLERSRNMLLVARRFAREGNVREAREIIGRVRDQDPYNPKLDTILGKLESVSHKKPVLIHPSVKPDPVRQGQTVIVSVNVTLYSRLRQASLHYRYGLGSWKEVELSEELIFSNGQATNLKFTIPGPEYPGTGLEYWIEITDHAGQTAHLGSREAPISVHGEGM
jgi:serine/threonine protein kinase